MKRKPKKNKTKTSNASGFGAPDVLIFYITLKQTRPWYHLQQANVKCTRLVQKADVDCLV